jgi:peptidoglycan lytic transglycosylase G
MSRSRLILSISVLVFLVAVFLTFAFAFFLVRPAERDGREQILVVKEGESLKEVAEELARMHLITNKSLFVLWSNLSGQSKQIKTGEYALSGSMAPIKILEKIRKGVVVLHAVTIPEGFTMEQIADLLAAKGFVQKEVFLRLANNPRALSAYGVTTSSLEGYLFPDTYHFSRGLNPSTLIEAMVKRFWQMVGPLRERADAIGMNMEEVVILASIVEKETGEPTERPTIASVFLNRLSRGMRLESDPTVIYGLKDFDGNLRKNDLIRETPYNTYVIKGLTPGPIASPGLDAIKAVLYPAQTDYLYFVSKNDGSHYFSKTLAEHNRAVGIYQKKKGMRQEKTS